MLLPVRINATEVRIGPTFDPSLSNVNIRARMANPAKLQNRPDDIDLAL
jgi:hypothetical protein